MRKEGYSSESPSFAVSVLLPVYKALGQPDVGLSDAVSVRNHTDNLIPVKQS
jgi:hypothetical protein